MVKECGYERVLHPLLCDLATLEQHGVYIEHLGRSLMRTVLYSMCQQITLVPTLLQDFLKASLWTSFVDFAWHPGLMHNTKR